MRSRIASVFVNLMVGTVMLLITNMKTIQIASPFLATAKADAVDAVDAVAAAAEGEGEAAARVRRTLQRRI